MKKIDLWASEGLRILGLAYKEEDGFDKKNFIWLGLVGIQDPVRPEAKEAIAYAQKAGIKIKIITGDYRKTAEKVATALGFNLSDENILEGDDLEKMSDEELKNRIDKIVLFSRVLPHQKLKIVQVLQEKGEIVAMTGDGVNDAPALKKANIGVTVNNATDVSKEASDLILLDSNFKTIIAACEEGRLILSNIKKVVGYVLSNSFAEIVLIFGAMILGFQTPLLIVQILWVHLICDGPPDILLGFEPKEEGIMERTPQEIQKESILSPSMKVLIFSVSFVIGILALGLFWYFEKQTNNLELARTIAFATVGSVSLVYIFSFKNLKRSIFALRDLFDNIYLIFGVIYGFLLIAIAIYVPFFNRLLETVPLKFGHWLAVFSVAIIATAWIEMVKYIERKKI
jgi:Ca2+-transporting ATPase